MAVLKQTSPTAWPSAPRPKPSSTVPSASTRSAVGLWSGQAEALSDWVMSALHSLRGLARQSRKSRIHMQKVHISGDPHAAERRRRPVYRTRRAAVRSAAADWQEWRRNRVV